MLLKQNKLLFILIGILLLANLTLLSVMMLRQPGPAMPPNDELEPGRHQIQFESKLKNELNLNADQIQKIRADRKNKQQQKSIIRDEMMRIRKSIHDEIKLTEPNMKKIEELVQHSASCQIQLDILNYEGMINLKNTLNSEQRIKFDSIMNEVQLPHPRRKQNHQGPPENRHLTE